MGMNYRQLVRNQVNAANFPFGLRQLAIEKILFSIHEIRLSQKIGGRLYCPNTRSKIGVRSQRARAGRPSLAIETTLLLSTLNTIWLQAFDKKAVVNRRGSTPNTFVKFVTPIMRSVQIYNVIDNLNQYRQYCNRMSQIIDRRGSVFVTFTK